MEKIYIVSIFTENYPGMLHRVTSVFTKRKQNIESITASESEIKGIHRYTIVIKASESIAQTIAYHLEKQVDVLKAFIHDESQIVHQELAMYKIPMKTIIEVKEVESIVRLHHARILTFEKEFVVIEKTGHESEIRDLYNSLEPYGILEFVRSGKVAITKPMKELSEFLKDMEESSNKIKSN